jgi:phosphate uptake regulator
VQLSGGSTYVVSLPKNWVEEMKIKAGDSITFLKNTNNSLTLFPGFRYDDEEKKQAVITTTQKDSEESLRRKVIATYLGGYKSIIIKSKGMRIQPEHARVIRNLVRTSMVGTEIVESSSESMMIQILTRLPELSFETALKRMQLMATNMHHEAIEALAENDKTHGEEIANMDAEVDRFSLYILRNLSIAVQNADVLFDMGLKEPADCLGYRTVISRIERIADHAVLIAKRVKFLEDPIDSNVMKKLATLSENSLKVFDDSITALLKKDYLLAETVAEKIQNVIESEKVFMSSIKDSAKNSIIIKFVLEDIRRTAEYSSDIVEVAIDENIHNVISKK